MPQLTPGLKITMRNSSGLRGETVIYVQNDRKRVEERRQVPQPLRRGTRSAGRSFVYVPAPPIVTITRCDLDQNFVLNLDTREYTSMPISKPQKELQARAAQQPKPNVPAKPTLLIETTTQDTGERKQMFGYMARHVITTVKQLPLVESSGQIPQETETDGWYIDLDTSVPCIKSSAGLYFGLVGAAPRRPGEPPQIPVLSFKTVGKRETGFALATKEIHRATFRSADGSTRTREDIQDEMQVMDLYPGPVDNSLFEVPKNFRKVEQIRRTPALSYWQELLAWLSYYWARLKRAI